MLKHPCPNTLRQIMKVKSNNSHKIKDAIVLTDMEYLSGAIICSFGKIHCHTHWKKWLLYLQHTEPMTVLWTLNFIYSLKTFSFIKLKSSWQYVCLVFPHRGFCHLHLWAGPAEDFVLCTCWSLVHLNTSISSLESIFFFF